LVLTNSERAWSYAMQLKQDMEIQTSNTRLRHHVVRRLCKAAKWASLLERLCAESAEEHTSLEAEAYAAWMNGQAHLEKEEWEKALDTLVKARTIYDKLGGIADPEIKQVFQQRVEDIDPSIRYCHYNLRKTKGSSNDKDEDLHDLEEIRLKGNDLLTAKLDTLLSDVGKQHSDKFQEISWKNRPLTVKNEKLQLQLVAAQEICSELNRVAPSARMALFDKLFATYSEASTIIRDDISAAQKLKAKSGKADVQEQTLLALQEYVNYLKLSATVQRSLLFASGEVEGKKKRPKAEDTVRLYENILTSLAELQELTKEDKSETSKRISAQIMTCKTYRCYWLAQTFAVAEKVQEALALFNRALSHVPTAKSLYGGLTQSDDTKSELSKLDELEKLIRGSRCKAHAKAFQHEIKKNERKETKDEEVTQSKNLVEGLDNYDASFLAEKRLVDLPPDFEPIACKPLLFDMAFNSCSFPNLDARKKVKSVIWFWR